MFETFLASDAAPRLGIFLGLMALLAIGEALFPRRPRAMTRRQRWPTNLAIIALNTVLARLVLPGALIGLAVLFEANGVGLFNWVTVPGWFAVIVSIVALDLVVWAQHVLFHRVPFLWRFHLVHHADRDLDVTTGLRFHPGEIVISLAIKGGAIALLGAPALGVLIFEVILNATSMFTHSNLVLPLWLDAALRRILVTPDMHRVHHSVLRAEHDSNYGFNFSLWDRLFGTYRAQPAEGHLGMRIGLSEHQDESPARLSWLLARPFQRDGAEP
ncbi:MAG: sterol desaturase family protein [Alphaproteobacteria bacterium]|nr:sterol desaturase family protein [Alphaproteobacteria bacterium]